MKRIFVFVMIALSAMPAIPSYSQQLPIDSSCYESWTSVEGVNISNDGATCFYRIRTGSIFTGKADKVILQSTNGMIISEINDVSLADFTSDSRYFICMRSPDILTIFSLNGKTRYEIKGVSTFKVSKDGNNCNLFYQLKHSPQKLYTQNLQSESIEVYDDVKNYFLNDNNLYILKEFKDDRGIKQSLHHLILTKHDSGRTIWQGTANETIVPNYLGLIIDSERDQLSFISKEATKTAIWLYKPSMNHAKQLPINFGSSTMEIVGLKKFSVDGQKIFFFTKNSPIQFSKKIDINLNVWSYADEQLQSYQLKNPYAEQYLGVINLISGQWCKLESENEFLKLAANEKTGIQIERIMGKRQVIDDHDFLTNRKSKLYQISLDNFHKKRLKVSLDYFDISPNGKFLLFFNRKLKKYFTYNLSSSKVVDISKNINTSWNTYGEDHTKFPPAKGIVGWGKDEKFVLIYDENDIWKVDPKGVDKAINITQGYGKKNITSFEVINHDKATEHQIGDILLLSAFNRITKKNGFFSVEINSAPLLKKLILSDNFYYAPMAAKGVESGKGFQPLRARDSETYIIRRMSAGSSPNYFSTNNFKNFIPLSQNHPENKYNWYTTELHSWISISGERLQGILYKPQNFDSSKKYPVILHYYEQKSNNLNVFIQPNYSEGNMDIPTMVNKGYLVFEPDIRYRIGYPGRSAYNSIVSAAKYLSKKKYVEARKLGLQGMSWGGYETNYVVTHSNLFAAACSSSGFFNFSSGFGSLEQESGNSLLSFFYNGFPRIGGNIWNRKDLFLQNSPIFFADKVKTPLLLMHTTNDPLCHFSEAIQFFTSLWQLKKPAWMLEYTDGSHKVYGNSSKDFTIRMSQFFDHFLQNKPIPGWMRNGIPANQKGGISGLELIVN